MTTEEVVQGNRRAAAFVKIVEAAFGEVDILEIIEVTENRLARVEALRATGAFGQLVKPSLDFWRKAKSEHGKGLV
jgi:hypothetical protein